MGQPRTKKLALRKETLRQLVSADLGRVRGGGLVDNQKEDRETNARATTRCR